MGLLYMHDAGLLGRNGQEEAQSYTRTPAGSEPRRWATSIVIELPPRGRMVPQTVDSLIVPGFRPMGVFKVTYRGLFRVKRQSNGGWGGFVGELGRTGLRHAGTRL